ncbi:UdgX family uracil-DNA binding protein [Cribrihabitans neustonicus]|uniref:UdgX family uracil-DNA binding protein n=1 Tax=Cribrihabitans neustonicus TaxID=1429085 RepID=UPI003B5CFC8E
MQRAVLPRIGTAEAWRAAARGFLAAGVPPSGILWRSAAEEGDASGPPAAGDLFAGAAPAAAPAGEGVASVPRSFLALANSVVWHSDPERFARLYAFLWRLREAPWLMSDRGDPGLALLRRMEKGVHRCQHKMKAFVRFREVGSPEAPRRAFAAWFEPEHHTVEPTAAFFARRFGDMDWRILSPDVSAIFEGGTLRFEPGQPRPGLPEDASEALWLTYFRSTFNPARLNLRAMQSEMPKKYWKNMPEAAAIPELAASASERVRAMAAAAPVPVPARAARIQAQLPPEQPAWQGTGGELAQAIRGCIRCPLYRDATQAVPGQGPENAALMIVGEQPGDQEDLSGLPFTGPAGQLLDQVAARAGLDRKAAYVTNAVKHFKFKPRGKRRLHERPNAGEVAHCKWWLDAELAQVRPRLVLALGATAAGALLGEGSSLRSRRGTVEHTAAGLPVLITFHPAFLLRQQSAGERQAAEALFEADLRLAAQMLSGAGSTA